MEAFFAGFGPLISAQKLRKIFECQDCADPQIITSLTRSELDSLLSNANANLTIGLKKRIWERIHKWKKRKQQEEAIRKIRLEKRGDNIYASIVNQLTFLNVQIWKLDPLPHSKIWSLPT